MLEYPAPHWVDELRNNFVSRNYHQFVFEGNIYDSFFWPSIADGRWENCGEVGKLYSFKEFLIRMLLRSHDIVFYYTSTSGITPYRLNKENKLVPQIAEVQKTVNLEKEIIMDVLGDAVKKLMDRSVPTSSTSINDKAIENILKLDEALGHKWYKETDSSNNEEGKKQHIVIASIIDFSDRIFSDSHNITDKHLSERIQRWGLDMSIRATGNISILITENRSLLPQIFHTDNAGTLPINVLFPNSIYRKIFFMKEKEDKVKSPLTEYLEVDTDNISTLVQLTRGFRISDCDFLKNIALSSTVHRYFFKTDAPSTSEIEKFIRKEKRDVIFSTSRGMLEPFESRLRFEDIGGLEGAKEYFRKISKAISQRDENPKMREIIPKGVLLSGPPGTGKTLLAKALATESGISLVKMGDIRSMWVGESERNLSMVLNLLKAMEPVIVFIDEIDQALGSRSSSSGDSGVGGRMFGKILEFMGDNDNRGEVIWIAATNRTDLLDDAMIRRFDRVIPILLPGSAEEWISVMKGIVAQMGITMESGAIEKFIGDNIDRLRKNHSGSSMEMFMRYAYQRTIEDGTGSISYSHIIKAFDDFKTNFNQRVYEFQTLLAISACNEINFIPKPSPPQYSYGDAELDEIIIRSLDNKTNTELEKRIRSLKRDMSMA